MKQSILYIAAGLCLAACSSPQPTIEVRNSLDIERQGEIVSAQVDLSKPHILRDAEGNEVPYQVVDSQSILFQANVPASGKSVYTWTEGTPAEVEPLTTAFFLGDRRKDDFCWENDKAAYRMYGPALLPENPSSGVDLWLKHSSKLTADAMYKQEENEGKPYHIDYGLGIDSYKVGHAAGCGGLAIVVDGKVWPGGPFARWEILQEGPLQTIFQLSYDSVQIGDKVLTETIKITVNAGADMNKAEVVLNGDSIENLRLGGAIFLHDLLKGSFVSHGMGMATFCEPANSDKGIYKVHEQHDIDASELDFGRNYCAVYVPGAEFFDELNNTQTVTRSYKVGETLTYYFGGAWSKRDYATDGEWITAINNDVLKLQSPLTVVVE